MSDEHPPLVERAASTVEGCPRIRTADVVAFCSALNDDGRPESSGATTSPSITMSFGRAASTMAMAGYYQPRSFLFLDRGHSLPVDFSARSRCPSSSLAHEGRLRSSPAAWARRTVPAWAARPQPPNRSLRVISARLLESCTSNASVSALRRCPGDAPSPGGSPAGRCGIVGEQVC